MSITNRLTLATILAGGVIGMLSALGALWYPNAAALPTTYYVSPSGSDQNDGTAPEAPLATIQLAVDRASPGAVIQLAPGDYFQDVVSRRDGARDAPITIEGPASAVLHGGGAARMFEINHDYITLDGFTLDGLWGKSSSARGYREKLLYVVGSAAHNGVTGLRVVHMVFRNAGGECLRLRYFARQNEIAFSHFEACGVHDFKFKAGKLNGEAIYIGTAPEQRGKRTPTADADASNDNWIHHNTFDTRGNECVDIKEGASGNIVEHNRCTGQRDPKSGGFDIRGNGNVLRYNESYGNAGAGIRLGGDTAADGVDNLVYGNRIYDNRAGGIKFQRARQAKVCGNTLANNRGGNVVGAAPSKLDPTAPCEH
jgi:hypothetical protein